MRHPVRRWFCVGSEESHLVLIELTAGTLEGYIEPIKSLRDCPEEEVESWKHQEPEEQCELAAVTSESSRYFQYDNEDMESYQQALASAIKWVETTVGPAIVRAKHWELWLRMPMFWKYRPLIIDGKFVGLASRKSINK